MISVYITGFGKPKKETRYGDAQVISDGTNHLVIDGFCGDGTTKLIKWLKKNNMKKLYLLVSHWHDDHFVGIEKIINDSYFEVVKLYCQNPASLKCGLNGTRYAGDVKECINDGNRIIKAAKSKGSTVVYLQTGSKVQIGEIKFYVWRKQPTTLTSSDTHAWAFINDGSLCTYFPDLYYLTTGDGPDKISEAAAYFESICRLFKIPHHGNNCPLSVSRAMYDKYGARYAWYNDLEPNGIGTNEFTQYGAKRCKEVGIKVIDSIGDINLIASGRKMRILHGGKEYIYTIPYNGKSTLKGATPEIVKAVFQGKYGSSDARITNLLDAGYDPTKVQTMINKVCNLAADIKSGKVNYGKGEERIKKIDAELGKGYGDLVQKQINVLYGKAKW